MMVVLEKERPDGTVRPYTLGWAEAGMRAAGEANRHAASAYGSTRETGCT